MESDRTKQRAYVLVVDDNPVVLEVCRAFLEDVESLEAEVSSVGLMTATSGDEALDAVRQLAIDGARVACALVDMHLDDGADGIEIMRSLWEFDPDIHCTLVTGEAASFEETVRDRIPDVFRDKWNFLGKPFTQVDLVERVLCAIRAWLVCAPSVAG